MVSFTVVAAAAGFIMMSTAIPGIPAGRGTLAAEMQAPEAGEAEKVSESRAGGSEAPEAGMTEAETPVEDMQEPVPGFCVVDAQGAELEEVILTFGDEELVLRLRESGKAASADSSCAVTGVFTKSEDTYVPCDPSLAPVTARVEVREQSQVLILKAEAAAEKVYIGLAKSDGGQRASPPLYFKVTVKPKEIVLTNVKVAEKVYDGTNLFDIEAEAATSGMTDALKAALPENGHLCFKQVPVSGPDGGAVKNVRDSTGDARAALTLSTQTHPGWHNFTLSDSQAVPVGAAVILPEKLRVDVIDLDGGFCRDYHTKNPDSETLYRSGRTGICYAGFAGGETADVLSDYAAPVFVVSGVDETSPAGLDENGRVYPGVIGVDIAAMNQDSQAYQRNYQFFEGGRASLRVLPEAVAGSDGGCLRLSEESCGAFIDHRGCMYIRTQEDGRTARVKFQLKEGFNGLLLKTGEQWTDITDGYDFADLPDVSVQTFRFVKLDQDPAQQHSTQSFSVNVYRDDDPPEAFVVTGQTQIPFRALSDTLVFGIFSRTNIQAKLTVCEPQISEAISGSGIKSCRYGVADLGAMAGFDVQSSVTYADILDAVPVTYKDIPVTGEGKEMLCFDLEEAIGALDDSKPGSGCYVIFAEVTDWAGNTMVCGSSGIIVENIPPDIQIAGLTDAELTENTIYVNSDAVFEIVVRENRYADDICSGIQSVMVTARYENDRTPVILAKADYSDMECMTPDVLTKNLLSYVNSNIALDQVKDGENQKILLMAEAVDFAGNVSRSGAYWVVIDKKAPSVTCKLEGTTPGSGYYRSDVAVTTNIAEQYLEFKDVVYTISYTKDGQEPAVYTGTFDQLCSSPLPCMKKEQIQEAYALSENIQTDSALPSVQLCLVFWAEGAYSLNTEITDRSGNRTVSEALQFVIDRTPPKAAVTVTPEKPSGGTDVFSEQDHPGIDVTVTDIGDDRCGSGIFRVSCTVVNQTTGTRWSRTLMEGGQSSGALPGSGLVRSWSGHMDLEGDGHRLKELYSNDVRLFITVTDGAGNTADVQEGPLKIDTEAPGVDFEFDTSDISKERFFNTARQLMITVNERNFDPSCVPEVLSASGGGYTFSGWSSHDEIHTGVLTFHGDSDYTVQFQCRDLAGNLSDKLCLPEFTVDRTPPEITVSYEDSSTARNGHYYKDVRRATLVITEHNFCREDARIKITAVLNGREISVSKPDGWTSDGDRHTMALAFEADGDYTLEIACTDSAGNRSPEIKEQFTIDRTPPEIFIDGVKDCSANKSPVIPAVTLSDANYDARKITLTLHGVKQGSIPLDHMLLCTGQTGGQQMILQNFADASDDLYTLTAEACDLAGNKTCKQITFSVNREGSNYILSPETVQLLKTGITNCPGDIVIEEINVDTLEFVELVYSRDGDVIHLKEGIDYTVESFGGDGSWKRYIYTIRAGCFETEGAYAIHIYSQDKAQNAMTNRVKGVDVEFIVDKTPPLISVSNLEQHGIYREHTHEFTVSVRDNAIIDYVELLVDNVSVQHYDAGMLEASGGLLTIAIDSRDTRQTITIIACDAAGNTAKTPEYEVLVTDNRWIQFILNKPLLWGGAAAMAAAAALLITLIVVRRRRPHVRG